jgi:hypothetical protein
MIHCMRGAPRLLLIITLLMLACEEESDPARGEGEQGGVMNPEMTTPSTPADQGPSADIIDASMEEMIVDAMVTAPDHSMNARYAQCETPLGGEPWDLMVAESQPGFEEDMMAISLDDLPEVIDISNLIPLYRGILAYALDIAPEGFGDTLQKSDLLNQGMLGRVVAVSLALGQEDIMGIDFIFLRRGLHRYYHCDRQFPLTLDDFRELVFDYQSEEAQNLESIAKCGTRRLIIDEDSGVYVAETYIDGIVRETEILLSGLRRDGNLDFLIYNIDGQLSDRTRFPTTDPGSEVLAASPYVCTSCHVNPDRTPHTYGYELLFPEVGPCAP